MAKWDEMIRIYHEEMGWNPLTGQPEEETLRRLGLHDWWSKIKEGAQWAGE
jgi:aldehyde:ferredoxin oxidoreductase